MDFLNRILCGNALELMRQIPDSSVHLAITSPPYNLGISYDLYDDAMSYESYLDLMKQIWAETRRVLVPGGRFALNVAPTSIKNFRPIHHDFSNQLRELGMIMRTEIIWYKQTMKRRTAWGSWKSPANPHIVPSWEYVLVFSEDSWKLSGDPECIDITDDEFLRFSDGFWYIPPEPQRRGHPTPFPEELIYRLVKFYSYRRNVVLDMFGGTGTVAVVSHKTRRNFVHIDISPKYCEIAEKRLEEARENAELPVNAGRVGKRIKASQLRTSSLEGEISQNGKRKNGISPQPRLLDNKASYKEL